jgi:hypothetical protein
MWLAWILSGNVVLADALGMSDPAAGLNSQKDN